MKVVEPVASCCRMKLVEPVASCCRMKFVSFVTIAAMMTVAVSGGAWASDELPPLTVVPAKTTVLILPPIDVSAGVNPLHTLREGVASHRIQYEFITRGFKVVGPDMAQSAAKSLPAVDITKPEGRTADTLGSLGKQTNADWVVSEVSLEDKTDSYSPGDWRVHATIHLQIWDVARHGWLSDFTYIAHKGSNHQAAGPLMMFDGVLDQANLAALSNTIGSYPQVVQVTNEEGNTDYLAGQKKVFVPDAKKPFSGLNPPSAESGTAVNVTGMQ
jgi:hypothetical protein